MRTRVKICGITTPADAQLAATAGADAIGLVFHAPSPRHVSPEQAHAIVEALPPFVAAFAVVLDPLESLMDELANTVPLAGIQYHGNETPEFCARFPGPWIKAVSMNEPHALTDAQSRYPKARGFLLDSHAPGQAGGQGKTFDWAHIEASDPRPLILAGGLDADNVAQAIRATRPWGVDVSSGVEAEPGRKDPGKVAAFMHEVRHVTD